VHRLKLVFLGLTIAMSVGASLPRAVDIAPPPPLPVDFDGQLSVMTYNVHGVPWPVGWGRPAQLTQIAGTLRDLRSHGRNPHIVVLQEAFTEDAKAIGREAGYRYIVDGPSAELVSSALPTAADLSFANRGSWMKGEKLGKFVGSGLQILSDFPVVGVRRMAYPAYACAGYDCLANKGALLASVALPGRTDPVDIVTTHLNSRRSSGVDDARSIYAYRLQVKFLTDFIRRAHDPQRALLVAGDFNVGRATPRRTGLLTSVRTQWAQDGDIDDAYGEAARIGVPLSSDDRFSHSRARDWQFYAPGKSTDLELDGIDVPFGHNKDGGMLSDHVGYTAVYRIFSRDRSAGVKGAQSEA
jgi:endonuclease/exonuclease/phosphatase family metal-dependent hydrolase